MSLHIEAKCVDPGATVAEGASSDFGVDFPGLSRLCDGGKALEEVRTMATEVLERHIEGMLKDRKTILDLSLIDTIMNDPDNRDAAFSWSRFRHGGRSPSAST